MYDEEGKDGHTLNRDHGAMVHRDGSHLGSSGETESSRGRADPPLLTDSVRYFIRGSASKKSQVCSRDARREANECVTAGRLS